MAFTCEKIGDPIEQRLCKAIGANAADAGTVRIDYRKSGSRPLVGKRSNGTYEPSEVYRAALKLPTSQAQVFKRAASFRKITGQPIPWVPSTKNWTKIDKELTSIKGSLRAQGIHTKHVQYRKRLALRIYSWLTKTLRMKYLEHSRPEGTIDDIFKRGYFRCSEFATLMYGIAHIAGLKAYPVEIHRSGNKKHAAIAIMIGNKRSDILYVDGKDGPSRKPAYRHYYLAGATDLFGLYLHNKSLVQADKTTDTVHNAHLIKLASRVAPKNAFVNDTLGTYYANKGSWSAAIGHFKEAAELRRGYSSAAFQNYCNALADSMLGMCTERTFSYYERKGKILP